MLQVKRRYRNLIQQVWSVILPLNTTTVALPLFYVGSIRERDRQTDRDRQRQGETERDRERPRETERKRDRDRDRDIQKQTETDRELRLMPLRVLEVVRVPGRLSILA